MQVSDLEARLGFSREDKARWIEANGKYYDDPEEGWRQKLLMHAFPQRSASVYVMPAYQSPVTGKWIDTPAQRRDDLARNNCRPWEGLEQEKKEAAVREQRMDADLDKLAEKIAVEAWQNAPESTRQALS